MAADLPLPEAPFISAPALYDWTGFYAGVNGGFAIGTFDYSDVVEDDAVAGILPQYSPFDFDGDGWLAGGEIGYNMQSGAWVFGGELDAQWTDIEGDRLFTNSIFADIPSGAFDTLAESELEFFGTARARVGRAFDRFHLYGTGGLAYGEIDSTLSFPPAGGGAAVFTDDDSEFHFGFAAGAGGEFAITDHLVLGAEYLFLDLLTQEHSYLIAGDTYTMDVGYFSHIARGSVKYKF